MTNVLHMNAGNEETCYANNSYFQKNIIVKAKPVVDYTINSLLKSGADIPGCIKIADFGSSSGPNTFLSITGIISSIHDLCEKHKKKSPEFQVFLNDLPGNDFNAIFKSTPDFYEGIKKEKGDELGRVFVTGVPGSFYQGLFPTSSLNFAYSANSLHWLSQVPDGIEDNKGSIYMSKKSPPHVLTSYAKQFAKDFSSFLSARGEEIVSGGHMTLEFFGRSSADPTLIGSNLRWHHFADSLIEMAEEGLVKEVDVNSFNVPYYTPFCDEVRKVIEEEGSFSIAKLEPIEVIPSGPLFHDEGKIKSGKMVAEALRAVLEPMFSSHFGSSIIDDLFMRVAKRMAKQLSMEEPRFLVLVISLARK